MFSKLSQLGGVLLKLALKGKFISAIVLILLAAGVYSVFFGLNKNEGETRYVAATVEKGALVVSVSASGQVLSSEEVDVKPKVSGDLYFVGVKNGDEAKAGKLLFKIDESDFSRAVQEAEINLESARLELAEILEPPDELDLL